MKKLLKDNRGQGGITSLFVFLVIYFALSIAFITLSQDIIENEIVPIITGQQFDTATLLLFRIAATILWAVIPIAAVGAALRGQEVSA